ncbi:MAG TPA: SDR family NAD(P)-dependent oxidoreductase, partial [Burkholderiaceae bacterium]|nr:SDR family NAD(P)-dependent oxidoreductase [Burkholderiaceae bacterium]
MKESQPLEARNIIVTGAAQGIGREVCRLALAQGASVVGVDINGEALARARAEFGADRFIAVTGSVADPATAEAATQACREQLGPVQGLVNNAGIIRPAMIEKMS